MKSKVYLIYVDGKLLCVTDNVKIGVVKCEAGDTKRMIDTLIEDLKPVCKEG